MKRTPKCRKCKKPVKGAIRESKLTCREFLAKESPDFCSEECKVDYYGSPIATMTRSLWKSMRRIREIIRWRVILDNERAHKAKLRAIAVRRRRWKV